MPRTPILDELHEVRRQILAEHGEHLSEYLHEEFERLKAEGHLIAKIKPRRIRRTAATKLDDSPVEHQSPVDDQ